MWPADTDDLPQVTTVMCIEPVKLCFRQAPSGAIPANSPSLGRSLRHFRPANISVRGDGNLRHLSIGFFFRFRAIISYFPVIIPMSGLCKKQRWHLDEVGHHVQEMQEKRKRTRPTLAPIG